MIRFSSSPHELPLNLKHRMSCSNMSREAQSLPAASNSWQRRNFGWLQSEPTFDRLDYSHRQSACLSACRVALTTWSGGKGCASPQRETRGGGRRAGLPQVRHLPTIFNPRGADPYPRSKKGAISTRIIKMCRYYQWVCFALFFQAIVFYVPR